MKWTLIPSTLQRKALVIEIIHLDSVAIEDHCAHLMCDPVFFKIQEGTNVSRLLVLAREVNPPPIKSSFTGRYFLQARGPDGTMTTSSTFEKPLPSLVGVTGSIVFERHGGSRPSDYWQQRTKSRLSRVHVVPRKALFT